MVVEEIFGADIPDEAAEHFGSPREMVDWLEPRLAGARPNKQASAMLRKLAETHQWPELAAGLDGTWRREQIAAIVHEILQLKDSIE